MRFTFVVPGLARLDGGALRASRTLSRLASWATVRGSSRGWRGAVLAALGAPSTDAARDLPAAPLAALGAGVEPHAAYALFCDPVELVAGLEDVTLAARIDDLSAGEAQAIVEALNVHFADDGLAFAAPRPDTWFVTARDRPELRTTPIGLALGAPMSAHLPDGGDSRLWQRWATEIQMLLHAHPVNRERERAGRPPFNGVWFWGGGALSDIGLVAPFRAHAPEGREGDFLRGLALHAGGEPLALPSTFDATIQGVPAARPATHVAVMLPRVADAAGLAGLERNWLEPAAHWLARGRIASVALVADGEGQRATTWIARRPSLPGRLRARIAPRRFAPSNR